MPSFKPLETWRRLLAGETFKNIPPLIEGDLGSEG